MGRLTLHLFLPVYSHHRAVADAIGGLEGDLAHGASVSSAWIGISDGVWVDGGSVGVGFLTSNVVVLIEGLFLAGDSNLGGDVADFVDGDLDLEGFLHGARLSNFLGDLHDDLVDVSGGDLDLECFFTHFSILNTAGNLLLIAFVDNLNFEFRFNGASASGSGTATAGLTSAAAAGGSARAANFLGKWHFLPDFFAHGLELVNSALSNFGDLTGSGHGVHDNSGLLDLLIDHDGLGECFFDGAHLNLSLELLVFDLSHNGLELRLLFVCVLVLDGEGLFFNFRLACAVRFSLAAAASVCVREHLFEMGQFLRRVVDNLPLAPRVEEVPGEEPGELIAVLGRPDQVSGIDNVLSIGLASTTTALLFDCAGKSTWFASGELHLGDDYFRNVALLESDGAAQRRPRTVAASVDRSDLAHDIVTSA